MKRFLDSHWTFWGTQPDGSILGPFQASVPGHVHTDLQKEGVIPDQFWRDNALRNQWIEHCDFTYECDFTFMRDDGDEADHLVLEGIDTVSSIFLNGNQLGTTNDMHLAYEFDVAGKLMEGKNILRIEIMSITKYLSDKDIDKYPSLFSQDRVYMRRMQCTFGWDWVHRMISYGIWRPVYLISKGNGHIENIFIRTVDINPQFTALSWEAETSCCRNGAIVDVEILDRQGLVFMTEKTTVMNGHAGGSLMILNPNLWWPNGYGEPYLYTFVVRCKGKVKSTKFGIRTVTVEEIPDGVGSSYTIVVNGNRIFAKGGNWVPADPFPSVTTKDKYDHLIQLMQDGHMNMLRVWGGGIYERPEFWDACDRLGIMVSLDFMMACAVYPEKETWFITAMEIEVKAAILELRNHPSLIFYNGDNELAMNSHLEDDYPGKRTSSLVTMPMTQQLDPSRSYFPTSPFRGSPFNSATHGDCHISAWYDPAYIDNTDMRDYRVRIDQGYGRFLSECAVAGAPPMTSLLKMMTMDDICDEEGLMWEIHTKDNPYKGYEGITHYRLLEKCAEKLFGGWDTIFQKVRKMEYVHYEFTRLQIENYRRRKYFSSGILFWMYNDCWPASGWALVDYYGQPKAGYFGSKKAFSPILVSVENKEQTLSVWLVNDTLDDFAGCMEVSAVTTDGQKVFQDAWPAMIKANSASMIREFNKKNLGFIDHADQLLFYACINNNDNLVGDTIYFDCMPHELIMDRAKVEIKWVPDNLNNGTVTLTTDKYARIVVMEGELVPSDNYFDLMPGQCKSVSYSAIGGTTVDSVPVVTWQNS